jgi:hypothetical protein
VSVIVRWWRLRSNELRLSRELDSTLRLQAVWRGVVSRRRVEYLRGRVEHPTTKLALILALVRWRHHIVWESMQFSAQRLQEFWRRVVARRALSDRLTSRILQRHMLNSWRSYCAGAVVAAIRLQCGWRRARELLHFARARAACKRIQRAWNVRQARRCRSNKIAVIVSLQRAVRCWVSRRK